MNASAGPGGVADSSSVTSSVFALPSFCDSDSTEEGGIETSSIACESQEMPALEAS